MLAAGVAVKKTGKQTIRVMKKTLYFLAGILAIAACTKEQAPKGVEVPESIVDVAPVHELFVSIADLADEDASSPDLEPKAAISEADGSFSWTAGDEIAVKNSDNTVYKFVATGSGKSTRFTYTGAMTGTPQTVVFPYTADATTSIPATLTGPKACLAAEGIRMTGTISNNAVTLSYPYAFLKLSFGNVPAFASKLVFDGNVNDVTIALSLSERGEVVTYLPVDPSTTSFEVSIEDDNNNVIYTKSTSNKTFTAGNLKKLKTMYIPGIVFTFNDSLDKVDEARFFKSTGDATDWNENRYIALNSLSGGGVKWCILPDNLGWAMACLQMFKNNNYVNATDCIYLYRDFTFTIPSAGGLVTNYRTYYYLNSSNSKTYWGNTTKVHIKVAGTYKGEETMTKIGDYLFCFENSEDNYGKSMSYRFHNGNGWYFMGNDDYWTYTLNREYQYNFNG